MTLNFVIKKRLVQRLINSLLSISSHNHMECQLHCIYAGITYNGISI